MMPISGSPSLVRESRARSGMERALRSGSPDRRKCARMRALALRLVAGLAAGPGDRELLQLVPALEQGTQPARRRAAARPGLRAVIRVAILGGDLAALELAAARLGSALCAIGKAETLDCRKLLLELTPGRRRLVGNHSNDVVAQGNQIIERHRFELQASHQSFSNCDAGADTYPISQGRQVRRCAKG